MSKHASKKTSFQYKPIPWIYSHAGALLFTAVMKLHPVHRQLSKLEITNVQEYFNQYSPSRLWTLLTKVKPLQWLYAAAYCYINAIKRIVRLNKSARQDYFALNRHGCFTSTKKEDDHTTNTNHNRTPLLIIPGLNTPPAFFSQMVQFFSAKGYPVSVLSLPEKGLADVETAAKAMEAEIERLKQKWNVESINVIGHCLGGLIGQHYISNLAQQTQRSSIKHMISLGTGYLGAEGVKILKSIWAANHPAAAIPKVFDQLIEWNVNMAYKTGEVVYHNFITIWDFMVHFKNAFLSDDNSGGVNNYIIDDADIDHLTIVLNPKMFKKIELAMAS